MLNRYQFSLGVLTLLLGTAGSAHAERWVCRAPCTSGANLTVAHGKNLSEAWGFFVAKCNKKGVANVSETFKKNCTPAAELDENLEETSRPTRPQVQSAS